ncbi:hypothetical protein BpHYR1_012882 [Brachionus plicatilis]|uniref:Uncharacterized protein n=1 Tax=Brachionus plicatilis TaxID=10195 RepID=A0A3M7QGC2_BRAPC|nr:hypothetical protein BpHYR1_012882 [Brachionus plicatilis]
MNLKYELLKAQKMCCERIQTTKLNCQHFVSFGARGMKPRFRNQILFLKGTEKYIYLDLIPNLLLSSLIEKDRKVEIKCLLFY